MSLRAAGIEMDMRAEPIFIDNPQGRKLSMGWLLDHPACSRYARSTAELIARQSRR
jgi:hypothetical protein